MSILVPAADLAPSLASRVVQIHVTELLEDGLLDHPQSVTFILPGDLRVPADDIIVRAGQVTVQLDEDGKGEVRLPTHDPDAIGDGVGSDWYLLVRKSWNQQVDMIRVPAGTGPINLADINPLVETTKEMSHWLITNASAELVAGDGWGATVTVSGGIAKFRFTVDPSSAGQQGPQGIPGPSSPHAGSNIATSVRAWDAVGDGSANDTARVQAAIAAAGPFGFLDFEAGTYKVTGNLGLGFWGLRKSGPGVITDGLSTFRLEPRTFADVNTIWVNATTGSDSNDGISPNRPLKTLTGLISVFERMGPMMELGMWTVRLSGTITGGAHFTSLPRHRARVLFEGDPLDANGRPTTWIERSGAVGDNWGMRFESGEDMKIELKNLGFRGFNSGSGYGWLLKEGGFFRSYGCWTEDCQIGSGYVGRTGFSEIRSRHRGFTISGTRAQYNASGSWTECDASGGASEGFHISRNAVCHVDNCTANDNTRDGVWADQNTRVAVAGGTFHRNLREAVRGEGSAEIHLDHSTYGPIDFGVGTPNANGRRGVGLYGYARHTGLESVYGVRELMVDRKVGSWTDGQRVTSDRGLPAERVGNGSRIKIVAWGQGAGQLNMAFGTSVSLGTFDVPQTWFVEMTLQYLNGKWVGVRRVSDGGVAPLDLAAYVQDTIPNVTPKGTCVLLGVEFWTGG